MTAILGDAERIGQLAQSGEQMVERLRRTAFLPGSVKALDATVGIAEAATLLGCSTNRIRMAEQDGRLPPPPESDAGRRLGYSIPALLHMREVLGASPRRGPNDTPAIITVQNFKGGVGKSTVTTHLAHYLAVAGYRVLVVDCDSQATTTTIFRLQPASLGQTRGDPLPLPVDRTDRGRPALRGEEDRMAERRPDPLEPADVRRGI